VWVWVWVLVAVGVLVSVPIGDSVGMYDVSDSGDDSVGVYGKVLADASVDVVRLSATGVAVGVFQGVRVRVGVAGSGYTYESTCACEWMEGGASESSWAGAEGKDLGGVGEA
jgi:hypothetical protein